MPALHPLPFPSEPPILPASQQTALTVEELQKRVASLKSDNHALKQWGTGLHADLMTIRAQLVIQNVENQHLQVGLYRKEQKRQTAREQVAPGGKAIEATGTDTMDAMKMIQGEKAAASQKRGKGKTGPLQEALGETLSREEAHRKWEEAVKDWLKLRAELKEQGWYMKEAGNKPHLQDFLQASAASPPQGNTLSSLDVTPAVSRPCRAIRPQYLSNNLDDEFVLDPYES